MALPMRFYLFLLLISFQSDSGITFHKTRLQLVHWTRSSMFRTNATGSTSPVLRALTNEKTRSSVFVRPVFKTPKQPAGDRNKPRAKATTATRGCYEDVLARPSPSSLSLDCRLTYFNGRQNDAAVRLGFAARGRSKNGDGLWEHIVVKKCDEARAMRCLRRAMITCVS